MHRSQQWLKFSIATFMFTLASFAQKGHVPNRLVFSVEADQRRQAMSFSISTLLTRNLHDVFGENDPARLPWPRRDRSRRGYDQGNAL
jgi:hypothetical protein